MLKILFLDFKFFFKKRFLEIGVVFSSFNIMLVRFEVQKFRSQIIFSTNFLSYNEIELLSHGLRYALPPKNIEYSRWFLSFEKLLLKLKDIPIYDSTQNGLNFVRSSLKNAVFKYFYSFKPHLTELHKNYYKLINDLRKDKTIGILKPDKGNSVVLLNNNDYQQKMMTIINYTSKFKILNEDILTLLMKQDKINRFLSKIKYNKEISS